MPHYVLKSKFLPFYLLKFIGNDTICVEMKVFTSFRIYFLTCTVMTHGCITLQEMEGKQVVWQLRPLRSCLTTYALTPSFMLDSVDGLRTSTHSKKSQLACCATTMNDHFQLNLTCGNIGNHNRIWTRNDQTQGIEWCIMV